MRGLKKKRKNNIKYKDSNFLRNVHIYIKMGLFFTFSPLADAVDSGMRNRINTRSATQPHKKCTVTE